MSDRTEQARAEAERRWFPGHDHGDCIKCGIDKQVREGFELGVEWADANPQPHPRPGDGCQCTGYSQDAGGGYFEYLVEYEPACPEHSEHVYSPRTGVWEHANPEPRTITREELAEAVGILEGEQEEGALGTDALYQALIHLRIEVEAGR